MATSKVEIWNMALATCGSSQRISSETENSAQANIVRLWYDEVRKFVLKRAPWSCCLSWANLALVTERDDFSEAWVSSDPAPGWTYAYGVPAGMLSPFYLQSYDRFELGLQSTAIALMTNDPQPVLRYVKDQTTVSLWDTDVTGAIISMLAYKITPTINAKLGQRDRLKDDAMEAIMNAQTTSANTEYVNKVEALPEAVQARGYGGPITVEPYFYPFQQHNADMV